MSSKARKIRKIARKSSERHIELKKSNWLSVHTKSFLNGACKACFIKYVANNIHNFYFWRGRTRTKSQPKCKKHTLYFKNFIKYNRSNT